MNCAAVGNMIDLYSEGRCTPRLAAAVSTHLATCPSCKAKQQGPLTLPAPKTTAPKGFKARLRAAASLNALVPLPERPGKDHAAALTLIIFALGLLALHRLTPGVISQRPVSEDASPWRLP